MIKYIFLFILIISLVACGAAPPPISDNTLLSSNSDISIEETIKLSKGTSWMARVYDKKADTYCWIVGSGSYGVTGIDCSDRAY